MGKASNSYQRSAISFQQSAFSKKGPCPRRSTTFSGGNRLSSKGIQSIGYAPGDKGRLDGLNPLSVIELNRLDNPENA